jgi:hypothetical protein
LKHEADVPAAVCRQAGVIERGQLGVLEEQFSAAGMVEPAHDVEQGRLAAAGGAQ